MASVFKRNGKGNYIVEWNDHAGKRRTKSSRTTDKAAANRIAAKLDSEVALRREGIIDPAMDELTRQARRPIGEHLADYEARLKVKGTTKHVKMTMSYLRAIINYAEWQTAADIKADPVNRFSGKLKDDDKSNRTRQAYVRAIKGFARHLAREGKLPRDPLVGVELPSPSKDRRYERRALLPAEWPWLDAATVQGAARSGMAAAERSLLYRTALQTGLRSNELRSLTRGSLFLSKEKPYVLVKSRSTKDGKLARQYILADLADDLSIHIATKAPGASVFAMPPETKTAAILQADLKQACIEWLAASSGSQQRLEREQSDFLSQQNQDGEVLDFHSLRHTCGAWLALQGAGPKVIQTVMRHSTITLTMDTYGHLFPDQESEAIDRLGDLMTTPAAPVAATGTTEPTKGPKRTTVPATVNAVRSLDPSVQLGARPTRILN